MTPLNTILNVDELEAALADGLVKARRHPTLPLTIYNYAEKAVYTRAWTTVTRQCRGLIVHDNGEIVARPWPKFFNLGEERGTDGLDPDATIEVTDKADGSLGILVPDQDGTGPFIATRGSFTSEQAIHATELLRTRYRTFRPRPWITYLFEIVYPNNRIVLDYAGLDDLVLLGAVDTINGQTFGPTHPYLEAWTGPRTEVLHHRSLGEALAAAPRPNREGLVVRYPNTHRLIKIKQPDYVALHRIVTGLNARVVWQAIVDDGLEKLLEALPDEFQQWALDLAQQINDEADGFTDRAFLEYVRIRQLLGDGTPDRKTFALAATSSPHAALLFQLLDGKDIRPAVLKTLRPSGDLVPRDFEVAA